MRLALVAILFLAFAGCGQEQGEKAQPVLATAALPGLEAATSSLTAEDLAADFGTDVTVAGFASGTERVFQGASRGLDRVVSRTLEFESAEEAAAYVELVRAGVDDLYGQGTTAEPLDEGGRSGYLIDPAACACHRAAPTLTAVLARGARVTYLEINGDGADRGALEELLARAP